VADIDELQHAASDDNDVVGVRRSANLGGELLDEPQARAASAGARPDLELIRDRADDRDPQPALDQVVVVRAGLAGLEALDRKSTRLNSSHK
jgi:hypothetical protein